MKWYRNKILVGFLIAVGVTLISSVFVATYAFSGLHHRFANSLYTIYKPSEDIVIVAIDDKTFEASDASKALKIERFQDWSRSIYSTLLEEISKGAPKSVAFDIIFNIPSHGLKEAELEPLLERYSGSTSYENQDILDDLQQYSGKSPSHPADKSFGEALNKFKNVILAAGGLLGFDTEGKISNKIAALDQQPITSLNPNFDRSALINTFPDEDKFVRRIYPIFQNNNGSLIEHFDFKIAREFLGGEKDKISFNDDSYVLPTGNGSINVPLEDGKMLINYFADPFQFNQVSFGDVLDGKVDPAVFKDKIVLIGVTTLLIPDHHFSPKSGVDKTPGVEIHANAIQTILDQRFLYNQSALSQLLMILIGAALLAIALNYLNPWIGIALVLALGGAHTASAHYLFQNNGLILHMVHPYVALGMTYVSSVIYRYLAEVKQNKVIKGAFAHYVNREVVDELLKHPELLRLGGQKREITVFFSDIESFTSVSEKLTPEALVELMNEYMDAMSRVILKFGGTLDKYEGDAIMAFFNAPLDQPDHVLRAAEAVLACRQQLKFLHQKWQSEGKPLLNFRVGLASGEAVVGNMGSQDRFDYTAMGDVVNVGSRLESANKQYGTRTMVNQACAKSLKERFVLRELDLIRVKGKELPVQVFELLARTGELPEAGVNLLNCFREALALYRQKQFEQALAKFKECQQIYPDDRPTQVYILRCQEFIAVPPGAEWDGVFELKSK